MLAPPPARAAPPHVGGARPARRGADRPAHSPPTTALAANPLQRGVASPRGTSGRGFYTCAQRVWSARPHVPPLRGVGVASAIEEFSRRMSAARPLCPAGPGVPAPRLALPRRPGALGLVQVRFANASQEFSCRFLYSPPAVSVSAPDNGISLGGRYSFFRARNALFRKCLCNKIMFP